MPTVKIARWQSQNWWLGYSEEYPDYWTQGVSVEELRENLRDLYKDLTGGEIPGIRKVEELEVE